MENRNDKFTQRFLLRFIKLLNVVAMTVAFAVCWYTKYAHTIDAPFYRKGNWMVVGLFMVIYYLVAHVYSSFLLQLYRVSELVYGQFLSLVITDSIMYIITWLLNKYVPSPYPYFALFLVQITISFIWSTVSHQWYKKTFKGKRTIIVWDERPGMEKLIEEYDMTANFDVCSVLHVSECLEAGFDVLQDAEVVFLCDLHSHERNQIVKYCVDQGIMSYVLPRIGDVIMSGATKMHLFHLPILMVDRYNPKPEYLVIKRALDIILSALALLIFSPLMVIVAIVIKATDGGTVFYRQTRLTKDGKEFKLMKFRSMRMNAEQDGVARLSTGSEDPRITPVGRFIRSVRIDELPQLFNILIGDMAICGPRPERPEIAREYEKNLPEFKLRLQAKAGLTGYAQVYGQYNTTPYDKLLMDLMYIGKPSLAEDFRIVLATIKILFLPESTKGIAEGETNAAGGGFDKHCQMRCSAKEEDLCQMNESDHGEDSCQMDESDLEKDSCQMNESDHGEDSCQMNGSDPEEEQGEENS